MAGLGNPKGQPFDGNRVNQGSSFIQVESLLLHASRSFEKFEPMMGMASILVLWICFCI